jgi:hypothetical protein
LRAVSFPLAHVAHRPVRTDRRELLLPLALSLATLLVYVPRVCRTVAILGDSATFTAAAIAFGVPQPSGYPLFVLFGRIAVALPFGDVAWRVHLTSALFHAAAVGVIADAARRLTGSRVAAIGAALTLACSRLFFLGSLYAEAFPLNDLFTAIVLAAGLAVDRAAPAQAWRRVVALVVASGMASTNHQMIALSAPTLALLVAPGAAHALRGRPKRVLLLLAIFVAIVATGYSVVLLAAGHDARVSWGDVRSVADLARLFTRADYGGPLSAALGTTEGGASARALLFGVSTLHAFGPIALMLAVVGAASAWRRSRRLALALALGPLVSGPLFAMVNAIPIGRPGTDAFMERFFTMAHVPLALLVAMGIAAIEVHGREARWPMAVALPILAGVGPFSLLCLAPEADLRDDRLGAALVHDLVAPLEPDALLLVAGDALVSAATYACAAERACEARAIFSPGQLHMPWRQRQLVRWYPGFAIDGEPPPSAVDLIARNLDARPIYIAPALLDLVPDLRVAYDYSARGLWLRVVPSANMPSERAAIEADGREMLEDHGTCTGCVPAVAASAAGDLDGPLVGLYSTAFTNHARLLRGLFAETQPSSELESRAAELQAIGEQRGDRHP